MSWWSPITSHSEATGDRPRIRESLRTPSESSRQGIRAPLEVSTCNKARGQITRAPVHPGRDERGSHKEGPVNSLTDN